MLRMSLMGKRHQNVHIQKIDHGNSCRSSLTISLDIGSVPRVRLVTRKPLTGSTIYSLVRFGTPCGVSTTLSPLTSHTNCTPGVNPSLLRTSRGRTTCPLLESVVVTMHRGIVPPSQKSGKIGLLWPDLVRLVPRGGRQGSHPDGLGAAFIEALDVSFVGWGESGLGDWGRGAGDFAAPA